MPTDCTVQLYNYETRTFNDADGFSFSHNNQNGHLTVFDRNGKVDRLVDSFYNVIYVPEFDYFVCIRAKMENFVHATYPLESSGDVAIGYRLFKKPPPPQFGYSDKDYKELSESHEYYYQLREIQGFQSYSMSGNVININVKRVDDNESEQTVTASTDPSVDDDTIPAPWVEMKHPKGGFYYYNKETGVTQFERPTVQVEENQEEEDESWLRLEIKYENGLFEWYSLAKYAINYIQNGTWM
jgi:hypothetical protein